MTLLLTIEDGPHPQAVRQMRLDDGVLVIGRSAEADWRIDDPDSYVSRSHCTVTGRAGQFTVTDTSSGGLYLGNAARPLGNGNSAPLQHGMLLRLGDYVLRAAIREPERQAPPPRAVPDAPVQEMPARRSDPFDVDGFFARAPEPEPRPARPPDLPDPFGHPVRSPVAERSAAPETPPLFDDPFTLDPVATPQPEPRGPIGGFDWDAPAMPDPAPDRSGPAAAPASDPVHPAGGSVAGADAGLAAVLRGGGLDPADAPAGDPAASLEALGAEYRLMVEGLMQLLRLRASEKGTARIAQTVIGSAENNPLKFLPTVEDALAVMLVPRGSGFTDAQGAITGAVRDLAEHQANSWRGVQAALRRMVDRFDPKEVEAEVERLGLLETLLAGGRRAKLWELYERRFREIAEGAEQRFLGEVGADFRDAYEREEK